MSVSTDRTVRDKIVSTISGIDFKLGFDDVANVKDYLIEFEKPEKRTKYLMAAVDEGKKKIRAIAAQVTSYEDWLALRNVPKRFYSIVVRFYYSIEEDGEGIKRLIDAMSTVRGALFDLGVGLDGVVDEVTGVSVDSPSVVDAPEGVEAGRMLVATVTYSAEKANPNF